MKRLESGRSITGLTAIAAILFIAAVLTHNLFRAGLLVTAILVSALILVLSVSWARRVEAQRRQDYRHVASMAKDLSLLRNMSGSIAKSRESQRFQEEQLTRVSSMLEELALDGAGVNDRAPSPQSYFSPRRIPASKPVEKPSSHVAGRQAALQNTSEGSKEKLHDLLYPSGEIARVVAVLGSSALRGVLSDFCCVREINDAVDLQKEGKDVSCLVIEERFLTQGRWFGSLSAQGTHVFRELYAQILRLKKQEDVVVVVVANAPASHMTSVLRDAADTVLPKQLGEDSVGAEMSNPVISAIDGYTRK